MQRWFACGMPVQEPTRVHDLTELHGTFYCHECRRTWGSRPASPCSGSRHGWVRRPPYFTPTLLRKLKLAYDGEPDELMAVGFVRHPVRVFHVHKVLPAAWPEMRRNVAVAMLRGRVCAVCHRHDNRSRSRYRGDAYCTGNWVWGLPCGWLPTGYTASGLDPALQWLFLKHRLDLCDSWSRVGVQVLQLWVGELEAWLERCESARFEVQLEAVCQAAPEMVDAFDRKHHVPRMQGVLERARTVLAATGAPPTCGPRVQLVSGALQSAARYLDDQDDGVNPFRVGFPGRAERSALMWLANWLRVQGMFSHHHEAEAGASLESRLRRWLALAVWYEIADEKGRRWLATFQPEAVTGELRPTTDRERLDQGLGRL